MEQLDDEQVNWRPNESSNSIANLIIHIGSNVKERIGKGMNNKAFTRNRDAEFETNYRSKPELVTIINDSFSEITATLEAMNNERFLKSQIVRGRERSNLDMFIQSATHFFRAYGTDFLYCKDHKR